MFSRLCKNSIFPSANNNSDSSNRNERNEYRLHSATQLNRRQLPLLPIDSERSHFNNSLNFIHQEPPPSYQSATHSDTRRRKIIPHSRPISTHSARSQTTNVRSRVEQYRNRLSVSDSDSDNGQQLRPPRAKQHHHQQQLRNKNEILLDEDLFCPDLVRNCKSLPVVEDDQDYIEIDELTSHLSLHNEVGLPQVNHFNQHTSTTIMGQNVSLKRPKISLTWVLREQQSQQQQQQQNHAPSSIKSFNWKSSDKALFKKTSKSHEKLFSEKLYSENNINDFRIAKKLSDDKKLPTNDVSKNDKIKVKKFRDNCFQQQRESPKTNNYGQLNEANIKAKTLSQTNLAMKSNGSEANTAIYVTSAQSDSGVNRKYRRRRKKSAKFGYNINNINEFLAKCSLSNAANIPVVLSNATILYQTRTGRQVETPLPLGMILNSIFKNQNWLYVQTPHGEEGYVNYQVCLPLGIIQRPHSGTAKCWENSTDIFPSPCGNLTDSEKELQQHGGTRSEGRRTPKLRRTSTNRTCSEKYLDSLYLLASQPKIIDHSYAQLKPTNKCKLTNFNNFDKLNGDYVQLKHNQEKINLSVSSKRQMLLAIIEDFSSDVMCVKKGDVVKLLACKEYEDKLWYFIKNRDGNEFYIPKSVATEFL